MDLLQVEVGILVGRQLDVPVLIRGALDDNVREVPLGDG